MVFIIDMNKRPVNPCHPGQARLLLSQGKAAAYRQYPFTLILKEESKEEVKPLRTKIDPGSKTTGMAVVDDATGKLVFALELHRTCSYCTGTKIPLEIDHIVPKSRGGSNRVSNLTLACRLCNQQKGTLTAAEFGYQDVQAQAKIPLRDASTMNVMRAMLVKRLNTYNMSLETGTGGLTKFNRTQQNLEKSHWIDAACVGASTPKKLLAKGIKPLFVKATGHGSRQMCRVDRYGFPRTSSKGVKKQYGYQTGDIVQAVIPEGIKKGTYKGKVAIRSNGFFNITTPTGVAQGIKHSYCTLIQKSDGYRYSFIPTVKKELNIARKPAGKDNPSSSGLKSHRYPGCVNEIYK